MHRFRPGAWVAESTLITVAIVLYLQTLDNGLQPYELLGGDLITHHYAQVEARFANAPGYPIYTMLGWLWFHSIHALLTTLNISAQPNPIPILSAYSTLWAVLALWLLYRVLLGYTTSPMRPQGNWLLAWLLSAFFACTYFFWYYATTSEQYSSAVAQTLAMLYVYQIWQRRTPPTRTQHDQAPGRSDYADNRWLYLLAFLCGLSMAHMLTVAFIVPPLIFVVLHQAPYLLRSASTLARTIGAALLPLISYLYVYIRGAQHPAWRGAGDWESTWDWFLEFISTGQGREELGWGLAADAPLWGNGFPEFMWAELSIPLFVLGLAGIAFLPRRHAGLLYATLAIYLIFCWAYRLGNWYQVILPAYPLFLIGVAGFVARVEIWLMRHPRRPQAQRMFHGLVAAALLVGLLWRIDASLPQADSRNRPQDTALQRAALLLDARLPKDAALFAPVEDALALQYLTRVWRIRPDLELVGSDAARGTLRAGRPLLTTWEATELLLAEIRGPGNGPASEASANPDSTPIALHAQSPHWFRLMLPPSSPELAPSLTVSEASDAATQPDARFAWAENRLTEQTELVGVKLSIASIAAPAARAPSAVHIAFGVDATLYWRMPDNRLPDTRLPNSRLPDNDDSPAHWESGLHISVRLLGTEGYLPAAPSPFEPDAPAPEFATLDRSRPAPLLHSTASSAEQNAAQTVTPAVLDWQGTPVIADPYRFYLSAPGVELPAPGNRNADQDVPGTGHDDAALDAISGVEVILYRPTEDGFENVAVARLNF